jgi:cytochrome c-type biogenesis protein CcsB
LKTRVSNEKYRFKKIAQAFFTDEKRAGKVEQAAMVGGNLALASLLAARWVESGHFPLSNMYESLLFLAWGITGVHLVVTERVGFSKSAVPGALAAPTALAVVAGATLALPAELQRASALVPALKSNWLMMHVSVMMLSYATLLVGSLACMSFLVVDSSKGWAGAQKTLGFLDDLVSEKDDATSQTDATVDGIVLASTSGALESKVRARNRPKMNASDGNALSAGEVLIASEALSAAFPETPLDTGDRLLKEMDNLSYRCLGAGFALLTAGLISGAVWANEAWGSYWSWDPKETWALITWFTYATYLHSRLVAGKSKKEVAVIGSLGFAVVWVCYVGVNLWGVGLHSYGWFANK